MDINPGDYGSKTYKARNSILFWMYQADRFCSNDLHSFDKYFAIAGIKQENPEHYGFQYHTVIGTKSKYYYGLKTMTYLEFDLKGYANFTKAVADAHTMQEFLNNIAYIKQLNAITLAPNIQHELEDTSNIVVLLNADLDTNFFYYANEPKHGYVPDYTKQSN